MRFVSFVWAAETRYDLYGGDTAVIRIKTQLQTLLMLLNIVLPWGDDGFPTKTDWLISWSGRVRTPSSHHLIRQAAVELESKDLISQSVLAQKCWPKSDQYKLRGIISIKGLHFSMAWVLTQSPRRGKSFVVEETFPEALPVCVCRGEGEGWW